MFFLILHYFQRRICMGSIISTCKNDEFALKYFDTEKLKSVYFIQIVGTQLSKLFVISIYDIFSEINNAVSFKNIF